MFIQLVQFIEVPQFFIKCSVENIAVGQVKRVLSMDYFRLLYGCVSQGLGTTDFD